MLNGSGQTELGLLRCKRAAPEFIRAVADIGIIDRGAEEIS
jgi:hypothetical protein